MWSSVMMVSLSRRNGRVEKRAPDLELVVRLRRIEPAEPEALPGLELSDAPDVERADGGDLRVAAGGLPVDQEDDGLAVAHDLNAAERHAVRDDVVTPGVLDDRPAQPRAHAVALWRHLVGALEKRRDAARGESVVLGTEDDLHVGLGRVIGPALGSDAPRHLAGGRAEWEPIALRERPATQSPPEIGRAGAQSRRRVDAAGDRQIGSHPCPGGAELQDVAVLHAKTLPARDRRAVEGRGHLGAGDGHGTRVAELDAG